MNFYPTHICFSWIKVLEQLNRWQRKEVIPVLSFPEKAELHSFIFIFQCHSFAVEPSGSASSKSQCDLQIKRGEIPLLSKFPSDEQSKGSAERRARHAHQSSVLTVTFSNFCVISPPKSAQKIVQFKAICIWNYIHKLPHKDFFFINGKNNNGITTNNYHHSELREDFYM